MIIIAVYNPPNIFVSARLVQMHYLTEYSAAKTGDYPRDVPPFSTLHKLRKIFEGLLIINTIASIWCENVLGYLSLDTICPSERISRKR